MATSVRLRNAQNRECTRPESPRCCLSPALAQIASQDRADTLVADAAAGTSLRATATSRADLDRPSRGRAKILHYNSHCRRQLNTRRRGRTLRHDHAEADSSSRARRRERLQLADWVRTRQRRIDEHLDLAQRRQRRSLLREHVAQRSEERADRRLSPRPSAVVMDDADAQLAEPHGHRRSRLPQQLGGCLRPSGPQVERVDRAASVSTNGHDRARTARAPRSHRSRRHRCSAACRPPAG